MRTYASITILLSLVFLAANPARAQWVQTAGPYGGEIKAVAIDSNASGTYVFAAVNQRGVFRSTDNGASWTAVNSGLTNMSVTSLVVSGTNVFSGSYGGVFESTDNGTSWTAVNSGLTNIYVVALAASGSDLFAGTYNKGVFRSTDDGASWTAADSNLSNSYITSIAFSGTDVFVGTDGGVFRSTDNGTSWTAADSGLNTGVYALLVSGNRIFAGARTIFMSTDSGRTWSGVGPKTASWAQTLAASGTDLFAGMPGYGVVMSTDNGTSWTLVNSGLTATYVEALAVSGKNLFAGTDVGVFRSTGNVTAWAPVDSGITGINGTALAASGPDLFAGTYQQGLFKSTDNGTSWTPVDSGLGSRDVGVGDIVVAPNGAGSANLFAEINGRGMYLSTDNGTSWTPGTGSGLPAAYDAYMAVIPNGAGGTNLFDGIFGGGVFLSTDNGASWTTVNSGLTSTYIEALAASGRNLFAGTGSGMFKSTDNGTSWTAADSGLTSLYVTAIAVKGTDVFAGTGKGMFMSTDSGATWTALDSSAGISGVESIAVKDSAIFAGTYNGLYVSTDYGASWAREDTGYDETDKAFAHLTISGSTLFAAANYDGVWSRPLAEMVPPPVPAAVSPADNAADIPSKDTLVCSSAAGATGYNWQVSTGIAFSSPAVNTSTPDTTLPVQSLAAGTRYYWRVQSHNGYLAGAFSPPDSFTVMAAPAAPVLASPANNASDQPATLTLKVNAAVNVSGYHWQLSASPSFSSTIVDDSTTGAGDTANAVSSLQNLTKYYWRVLAYNAGGPGPFSPADSFTTIVSVPSPPAFPPSVPTSGVPRRPAFTWQHSANASRYNLQLSADSLFSTLIIDTTTTDTSVQIPDTLAARSTYYWHVSAIDTAGASAFSRTLSFTTGVGITGIQTLGGIPKTYALMQNYPNPFNPTTTIEFALKENSEVTLSIYNVVGERVEYWDGGMMEAGRYSHVVDMSRFASGVYFYRIVARQINRTESNSGTKTVFEAVKKFMLLK